MRKNPNLLFETGFVTFEAEMLETVLEKVHPTDRAKFRMDLDNLKKQCITVLQNERNNK